MFNAWKLTYIDMNSGKNLPLQIPPPTQERPPKKPFRPIKKNLDVNQIKTKGADVMFIGEVIQID